MRFDEGRIEALGEPAIDGGKQVVGLVPLAAFGPDLCEIARRPQLPHPRRLLPGDSDSFMEGRLDAIMVGGGRTQQDHAPQPMELSLDPALVGPTQPLVGLRQRRECVGAAFGIGKGLAPEGASQ